eukprot:2314978-Ditylum_brightwellii.AAC.1
MHKVLEGFARVITHRASCCMCRVQKAVMFPMYKIRNVELPFVLITEIAPHIRYAFASLNGLNFGGEARSALYLAIVASWSA